MVCNKDRMRQLWKLHLLKSPATTPRGGPAGSFTLRIACARSVLSLATHFGSGDEVEAFKRFNQSLSRQTLKKMHFRKNIQNYEMGIPKFSSTVSNLPVPSSNPYLTSQGPDRCLE